MGVLSLSSIGNVFASTSTPKEDTKVGAYYYIWWGIPFNNHWEHGVKYTPFLGEYNSSDPFTANRHILWAKHHGIDFFAVSWLGIWDWYDHRYIDSNLKNGFLESEYLSNFNFCLFYESEIVLKAILNATLSASEFPRVFLNDTAYAAENYFVNPSYLKIDEKPVLFVHNLPFIYYELGNETTQKLFDDLKKLIDVYLIGDAGNAPIPPSRNSPLLHSMDAVTSYFFAHQNISEGWQNIMKYAETYYPKWRLTMNSEGIRFIPNAYPGFDNTEHCGWMQKNLSISCTPMVLPLNETMFKKMLTTALDYADKDLKIVMITSWNEWLESTAIEPSMEFGELFLHAVLEAKTTQSCPDVWNVVYFAVGAGSGVIVTTIFFYRKSFRKRKGKLAFPLKKGSV